MHEHHEIIIDYVWRLRGIVWLKLITFLQNILENIIRVPITNHREHNFSLRLPIGNTQSVISRKKFQLFESKYSPSSWWKETQEMQGTWNWYIQLEY